MLGDAAVLAAAPERCVAIVGSRDASAYGIRMAERLAAGAARAGLVVVSGLARGIDAAAHEAAMRAGGPTVAVLGTGVDVPYPAGHRTLHQAVQQNGLVISEVEPGTRAFPGCFPRRNRIIAGLCKLVVVVEAGFKSGALNTSRVAEDLGRRVGAVPGQADDPRAAGSNLLIRDGCQVILGVEDLLMNMGLSTFVHAAESFEDWRNRLLAELWTPEDRALLLALGPAPATPALLAERTSLSVRQVSEGLLRLELIGAAAADGDGYRLPQEIGAAAGRVG